MVHIEAHSVRLRLKVVHFELLEINIVPFRCSYNNIVNSYYAVRYIKNMRVAFYEPFNPLFMRNLGIIMFVSEILNHIQEVFQKV